MGTSLTSSSVSPAPWKAPTPLPARFETERILLRLYDRGDEESLFRAVSSDREALLPWLPWAKTDHKHVNDSIFMIERMRRANADPAAADFVVGIFDRRTGEVIGGTGYHRMAVDWHDAEIGYWIRGDLHGKGLCTEAVRALVSWGFTAQSEGGWGFRRLYIRCASENLASAAVARKLAIRQEVNMPQERWVDGLGWAGTLGWGVLASEWDITRRCVDQATP